MSLISGYGAYQKYAYGDKKADQASGTDKAKKEERAKKADRTNETGKGMRISSQVQLSEKAQKLLEELQKTYDNMDFFVADYDSDEEAQSYLSRGTKEYSVLIDPETLEAMAADDSVKEKYLGILDEATGKLDQMKEELTEEEGANVKSLGVSIDKDGNVSYFAELEKMSERQRERIKQRKEEARAEEEEEAKRKEKQEERERISGAKGDREQPHIPRTTQKVSLKADSTESLLEQIRSVDWSQVKAVELRPAGDRFDFSI